MKNFLICKFVHAYQDISHARWAKIDLHNVERVITVKFDLKLNLLESFDEDKITKSTAKGVGSWYSSEYENWHKNHPNVDEPND